MDALEEYTEEKNWNPLSISSAVFSSILKSSNPVSVFVLGSFFKNFRIIQESELQVFLNEIKYL